MFLWLVIFEAQSAIKSVSFKITNNYLLLPIQEDGSPAFRTRFFINDKFEVMNDIRFANEYVTYIFPFNMTNWIGQEIRLEIDIGDNNIDNYIFWKDFNQSDKYESGYVYDERYRPWYHFTPEYGWMNDPNGMFITTNNEGEKTYHLHYQYNPYAAVWGNMHWGHAISKDLLHWEYLPLSLSPDSLGFIFSGSSMIDVENVSGFGNNTIFSYYTTTDPRQQQSLAYSTDDGFTWTKYEHNPIISNTQLDDFRDPKVVKIWLNENSIKPIYIMCLAVGQHIEFYKSLNLINFEYLSSFGEDYGAHGGVWECPDLLYFEEFDKHVLFVNINPGGPFGGSSCQYFVGKFNGTHFICDDSKEKVRWLEYGKDAYATVTYPIDQRLQRKRRDIKTEYIAMTWMSNWQYAGILPSKYYRSSNTIPRKISLVKLDDDSFVVSNLPIDNIVDLRGDIILQDSFVLNDGVGDRWLKLAPEYYAAIEFDIEFSVEGNGRIGFRFNNFNAQPYFVYFDPVSRKVSCNRDKAGIVSDQFVPSETSATIPFSKNSYKWRFFFDSCSVEFFDEDGLATMTNLVYPSGVYTSVNIFKENINDKLDVKSVRIYKIDKIMKPKFDQNDDQNDQDSNQCKKCHYIPYIAGLAVAGAVIIVLLVILILKVKGVSLKKIKKENLNGINEQIMDQ